ncbi:DUF4186 family protein [Nocardioides anomalus]
MLRWHGIDTGRALTREARTYVVDVVGRWIGRELSRP